MWNKIRFSWQKFWCILLGLPFTKWEKYTPGQTFNYPYVLVEIGGGSCARGVVKIPAAAIGEHYHNINNVTRFCYECDDLRGISNVRSNI